MRTLRNLIILIIIAYRHLSPLVRKLIAFSLREMGIAVSVWFRGAWAAIENMSRAYVAQAPVMHEYEKALYYAGIIVCTAEVLIGWILAAHVTVWITWVIF